MRSFLAIDLPEPVVDVLSRLQHKVPAGRAVPRDNLHLTLVFLDQQDETALSDLHGELEMLVADQFDLALSGLGCFGGRSPKLLFVQAVADPALLDLHRRVAGAVRRAGIELARQRYRPHVTLARFGRGLDALGAARLREFVGQHAGFTLPPVPVTGFSLFRSTLRPQGALHEELARYDLIGAKPANRK